MKDKEKINKLKAYEESKYANIDLDHLIMNAIGQLEEIGADLSYENAVVAAFKIFPKKFSLLGYPEYPDSNRVEQCLWRCTKQRQWLGGKTRQGFIINGHTRVIIGESEKLLNGVLIKKRKAQSKTRRKESILAEVKDSLAFKKYLDGKFNTITNGDICFMLQGTLDTSKTILQDNFDTLIKFSEELNQMEIKKFLDWVKIKFKQILNSK